MLDLGLIASVLAIVMVVHLAARAAPPSVLDRTEALDRLYGPVLLGVVAARVVSAALDDPTSLGSIRALLVIRGGVEFWAGVAAAGLALVWRMSRRREDVGLTLADLTPYLLWGYATYEVTCFLRDGCFGPRSPIGLVPPGLTSKQLPIGILVGVAVALIGVAVRHLWSVTSVQRIGLAVGAVAAVRSIASIWLPRLGDGPTRQHVESIVVLVIVAVSFGSFAARRALRRRAAPVAPVVPQQLEGLGE